MAGYQGYSKSNNAIDAEATGAATATALARELKCSSAAITANLHADEWHHTSAKYNRTDYYREPSLVIVANERFAAFADRRSAMKVAAEDGLRASDLRDALAMLVKLRAWRSAGEGRFANCVAKWTEWSGSGRRKTSEEVCHTGVEVTVKGAWAIVHAPSGDIRKKRSGNWFTLKLGEEVTCG